ncbi:hypothetical protein GUITHDRAFT_166878 [Guillardia theta CCMP2712]|uniref:Uncharacterized protein n=2 Tax=Guillardia theta TaxID=55529 RepID=L1I5F9_GUITC|nr:hypothetical protein GUITHDRAFT_166878 [Guillardia theta CCMP2712]EKX31476.1 hypothetical protein GUITHDRAFT_166878 [Guillardia theta CCMP2712]|eukprot:XP_005818456.1 hypothetical protein GUITHDRAFT_166878 [Guillardia theta CCMP2712]
MDAHAPKQGGMHASSHKPAPPSPRRMTLMERRKRKIISPIKMDCVQPFCRRNNDQACVLTAPATHLRLSTVNAGEFYQLHKCLDARTQEIFFYPTYVGPEDEKESHVVKWPEIVHLPPTAQAAPAASSENNSCKTPGRSASSDLSGFSEAETYQAACASSSDSCGADAKTDPCDGTLMYRRKRKAIAPLDMTCVSDFKRRSRKHLCILSAPATHLRVGKFQAGSFHVMHRCIDLHTKEFFLSPEYVGPPGKEQLHKVSWPEAVECNEQEQEQEQEQEGVQQPESASGFITGSSCDPLERLEVKDVDELESEGGSGSAALCIPSHTPQRKQVASRTSPGTPCDVATATACFVSRAVPPE